MKVLSMRDARLQDRIDARHIVQFVTGLDLERVRSTLRTMTELGYHRDQDLEAKLAALLAETEQR